MAPNALHREVVRIYERYAVEVVERFDLCPWATRARQQGTVRPYVLSDDDFSDVERSLAAITELAGDDSAAIVQLIYPRFAGDRSEFEHFLRVLRQRDATRHPPGEVPFAMAAFHLSATLDLDKPERLIPFLRRSPDPTLQLVRTDVLVSARGEGSGGTAFFDVSMLGKQQQDPPPPSIRERISHHNWQTLRRVGAPALESVFEDIARDRKESYARCGLVVPGA